jgi:serine/threonine protein kinase
MRGILEAINYCHQTRICHRDIKPENILINENDETKIIDLGFAAIVRENEKSLSEFKGTVAHKAPEIIKRVRYNEKCDIWSIGVVFYILSSFALPFPDL